MENNKKIILHLCARIGSDSMPYKIAGYNVQLVTKDFGGIENYHPPANVYGIISNPPCTMFSYARTTAKKPRDLTEGMRLVKECLRVIWECQTGILKDQQHRPPLKFWMLENPDGMLRWFLGKPAMVCNPYEFGEQYQKRTALWGCFNEPEKTPVKLTPENKKLAYSNSIPLKKFIKYDHLPTKDIAPKYYGKMTMQDRRSICSAKFAQAFFEVNQ